MSMTREKALEFVKGMRKKGKTYMEISSMLPSDWEGSREPGTLQRWVKRPPSDLQQTKVKTRIKVKTKAHVKRRTTIVVPNQPENSGKVLIMMCSIEQAKELLQ